MVLTQFGIHYILLQIAASATISNPSLLTLPFNQQTSSTNNSTAAPFVPYTKPQYICDPRGYPDADSRSCQDAANLIQGTRERLTFAQRHSGADGIPIPYNWVSSEWIQ